MLAFIRTRLASLLGIPATSMAAPNKFDDSRIRDNPDKKLLADIRAYFKTFTDPDPEAMRDFQADGYTMTDIRKNLPEFYSSSVFDTNLTHSSPFQLSVSSM